MALNVGAGFRSNRVKICRVCETVTAEVFPPDSPSFQAQKPQRHESQGHVVMPTDPAANFVMIQPSFAIASLEQLFDAMPLPLGTDHVRQGCLGAGIGQSVVGPHLAGGPHHNQTFFRTDTVILLGLDPNHHRFDFQGALLGIANGQACPPRLRLILRPIIDPLKRSFAFAAAALFAASGRAAFQVSYQGVARDIEHITFRAVAQLGAKLRRPTELVVARDPAMRQAREGPIQ
jgi:hypothetical protein